MPGGNALSDDRLGNFNLAKLAAMRYVQCEPEAHNQDPKMQDLIWGRLSREQQEVVTRQWRQMCKKRTVFKGAKFEHLINTQGLAIVPFSITE